jgi:3-dehydrosphinganine reductase
MEGKDDGIRVSIIYPPDTDTPLLQYEREHTLPECIALSKNVKVMSADKVAQIYFSGLSNNKFEIYCDINSRLLRWMKSDFPGLFYSLTQNVIRKERNRLKRIKETKPNQ